MNNYITENYRKYSFIKKDMIKVLQEDVGAKEAAQRLNLSLTTFYKYKNLLNAEEGLSLTTRVERSFLRRKEQQTDTQILR